MRISLTSALFTLPLALGLTSPAQSDDATLNLGVPAWPGITVKTEIASQLLAPLGYDIHTREVGLQVIYEGLKSGDLDAFLGAWLPAQNHLYTPLEKNGTITSIANNVDGAQMTLAVPAYLHEQGIRSFADLDDNRERFDGKIHSFGAGSAASQILDKAIDNDSWGLGDWQLVDTSVVAMLSAARNAISREAPIVWVGWKPHWMNLALDMRYLDDPENLFGKNNGESQVLTLMRTPYAENHPNLVNFFEEFTFSAEEQSWMINEFGQKERAPEAVAQAWLQAHPERIEAMLEDVTTQSGEPAWPVVKADF
ncbi:MAG: ABC transporter substrate-binding protein [Halomonas sp.]|nr:ABC transporter substrate-binding protein [Halomonas sp.]MDN6297030.1 ABC transporter substrate-binding protein [Halomonas sp.]MDN6313738.1 ABC transporter substrate-binding protein [Halomonas sp.]MDN6335717.1 ABC transporter substrate-binding protein [Halomonas sp.]